MQKQTNALQVYKQLAKQLNGKLVNSQKYGYYISIIANGNKAKFILPTIAHYPYYKKDYTNATGTKVKQSTYSIIQDIIL